MVGSTLIMTGAFGISLSPSGICESPPIPRAAALASWLWCIRSFSVSLTTAMYSFSSTNPLALMMNDSSVSAALRASSCVGEPGDEPTALVVTGVVAERPAMLPLLLLWRSWGEETVCSKLKLGPFGSLHAESKADGGAVDPAWYFGVTGSVD